MITLQTIYHKKNELFEVEFYKNEECTEAFDFTNAENLYSVLKDGDCTPLLSLPYGYQYYIPYINPDIYRHMQEGFCDEITTLNDITPNLSKYIPEDSAVLFLSEQGFFNYGKCFKWLDLVASLEKLNTGIVNYKKLTIFLHHGTQSELQKAEEVVKELKEKYGVEKVNLCVLHWFLYPTTESACRKFLMKNLGYNKIITTNSTGILKPEDSNERLQVINCKVMFEECVKKEETKL